MLLLPKIEALQLFFSWERRPGEPGGVERGAGCLWSGQLVYGEDVVHLAPGIWERNALLGNFDSAPC